MSFALDTGICVSDGVTSRLPSLIETITISLTRGGSIERSVSWSRATLDALCADGTPVETEIAAVPAGTYGASLEIIDPGGTVLNDTSVSEIHDPAGNNVSRVTHMPIRPGVVTLLSLRAWVANGDVEVNASLANPLDFDEQADGALVYSRCVSDGDCAAGLDCFYPPGATTDGGPNGAPYCSPTCTSGDQCPPLGDAAEFCGQASGPGQPTYCGLACPSGYPCPAGMTCINPGGAAFCAWL